MDGIWIILDLHALSRVVFLTNDPINTQEHKGIFMSFVFLVDDWFSSFRVLALYTLNGFYSNGKITTGTSASDLKVWVYSSSPIPAPTCIGIATLGWMVLAASAASSAVIT